ncbi:MAG: VanZ family protein [Myxococcota bacterium]
MTRETVVCALGLLLVGIGIAWAGLHPFDLRLPNRVEWADRADGEGGLRFRAGGMAVSRDPVRWDTQGGPARFEVELEVALEGAAAGDEQRDLFVLVDDVRLPAFAVCQAGADLLVADRVTNADGERWINRWRVAGVFAGAGRRRIRLAGSDGPAVFVDGKPAPATGGYPIPVGRAGEPLSGRVLLGTGPDGRTPWSGRFLGLALRDGDRTLARYTFDEGRGATVRSHTLPGLDLDLPRHFRSLRPPLGHVTASASDVWANLLGFVPFGFLLALLLRGRARAVPTVTAAGFGLSLAIELAQSLSVARMSSLEDLALNTLGAFAGAVLAGGMGRRQRGSGASST